MLPDPGIALKDVKFAEKPRIVRRADNYYLRYRIGVEGSTLRFVLVAKKTADKGYYYFSAPVSHPEFGNVVERPLAYDGLSELARRNAVYWLNPDGSEVALDIKDESDDTVAESPG